MPTTDRDAQALAYIAGRLREETTGARKWDQVGSYEVIKTELVGKNLAMAVEAVLCHATDVEAKTPGSLRRPFNPPRPSDRPKERMHPPRRGEDCPRHPGQWADNCGGCAADKRAVEYDDEPVAGSLSKDEALARMRAAVAASKYAEEASA
jgi:hypothetical protein